MDDESVIKKVRVNQREEEEWEDLSEMVRRC
jgi:hypothetical protein